MPAAESLSSINMQVFIIKRTVFGQSSLTKLQLARLWHKQLGVFQSPSTAPTNISRIRSRRLENIRFT